MGPDDLREFIYPLTLFLIEQALLNAAEDDAVGPFDSSVGLRVVHRSEAQLGSQLRTELSEGGAIELLVVSSDLLRDAEVAYNILPEELLQGSSCDVSKCLGFDRF